MIICACVTKSEPIASEIDPIIVQERILKNGLSSTEIEEASIVAS